MLTAALGDVTKQHGYDGLVRLFTSDNPFSTGMSKDMFSLDILH